MEELDYTVIVKRIFNLIDNDNRQKKEFVEYLGKNRQILYAWKNLVNKPSLEDLVKIAKYFGVPLEYLLYGEESPIDDATAAFLVQTNDLTEEQKRLIYASIKAQVEMFKKLNKGDK